MRNEGTDTTAIEDQTAQTAEWKEKARQAGAAAKEATQAAYSQIQDKTVAYSKATDQAIRENPYAAVGIAFGVGCLLGFLMTRGNSEKEC
jgi:ElaB/YqjD/DUF883 family membrane-anchored ribosome-binding protein